MKHHTSTTNTSSGFNYLPSSIGSQRLLDSAIKSFSPCVESSGSDIFGRESSSASRKESTVNLSVKSAKIIRDQEKAFSMQKNATIYNDRPCTSSLFVNP